MTAVTATRPGTAGQEHRRGDTGRLANSPTDTVRHVLPATRTGVVGPTRPRARLAPKWVGLCQGVSSERQLPLQPRIEHRLHVEDGCAVQRLEIAHLDAGAIDRHDLHIVKPDRIRSIGGPRTEHAE